MAVGDAGDSAAEGTDYGTVGDVTVTIPPGADTGQASFDLTPTDDTLDEEDEAISVTGAVSGEPTAVTGAAITITDDDSATSVVSIANASAVAEGNDPGTTADMTFALTLAPASGRDVTVPYTLSGTATPSDDYTGTASGSVTIMAGQGSATITVPVRGDLLHEGNETVTVTLGDPDHAALHATQKTATGTITDNDAKPTAVALSVSPDAVAEGDDSSATTVTVTATVTGATRFGDEKTVTVAVGDAGDSAAEGIDYGTVGAVTVTLPAGADAAEASFGLTPTDDSLDEEDEEISVTGAVTGETSVTVAGAAITITDDDDAVSAVSVANASAVTEGNDPEMTTDMTFAVSMAPVSGRLVTVPYTLDGTATPGDDYTGTASGSVTITAGASSATITVPVRGDVLDEANETVTVTLGNPTNADISSAAGAGNATGTITDDDAAVAGVTLSVSPDTVGEDDGEATTVTATVTGATRYAAGKTVTVAVGDAGDSAAEGTDYGTVGDVTVTIPPGADTGQASFDLTPTDDTLDEEDEAISVTGAVSGEPTAVTGAAITITDDDSATSVVSIANASAVAEGNDPGTTADMTFALTLAPASGRDVTVPYTLSGTATPSDDYTGTASGSVTIMAGQGSATITVPVRGDLLHEGNETVTVTLGDPDHAALHATQKTATGTITDNDAKPTAVALSVSPDAVAEGDDSSATTVTVTATVTGATRFGDEKTVTVAVGDAGDSAAEGIDYGTVGAVTVTLPAGADAAEASFGLTPTDDSLDEEDEEISVTGAVTGETSVTVAGAAITITDDDDAVSAVSVANASAVTEGNDPEMTTDMTFAVSMAPVSGRLVTVPYTLDGTATPGDDYTGTASGSVTITAGASSATITVPVRGDVLDEANETVTVTLGNPTNADISSAAGAGNATGTITDDDAAVAGVTLSVSPDTVGEDDGEATTVTVTATVTGATRYAAGKTVTVAVGDAGDSAAEGTDYGTVGDVTVTIPPGADTGQASFDLTPTDDTLDEEDEAISVTGAVSGEPTAVTGAAITITDDDSATSVVSIANASAVAEGNDPGTTADMTFALTLAPASGRDVTVPYTLSGTATPSDDYTGTASGSVTIMAGQGSATITVPVRGDLLHEGNETVTVTLGDPDHAALHATQKTATGTITDNDAKPTAVALSVSPDAVAEGDDSSATTVTVTATVTGATRFGDEKTVTVAVGDAGDSAAEGIDYGTVGAVTVTLPAGADAAEASFGLTPTDDSLDEEDEEISVTGAVTGETSVTVAGAAITITDDDDAVSAVSVANASAVTEGNDPEMTTDMTFAVSMAPVSGRLVTVPYTLDGTATPGDDYTGTASGSVTITAGASSATITVPVRGDVLDEANETVTVTLGNPTNADISSAAGAGNATGTITDDDAAVAGVTLSVSPDTVGEDDGEATTVTATVTGATRYAAGKTVTVAVGDAGDSAAEGTDYGTVGDVTVTIPPGADTGQASFDLTPTDDTLDEEDEAISVTGAVSGEPTAVTGAAITITDDDAAGDIYLVAIPTSLPEDSSPDAVLTVEAFIRGGATFDTDTTVTVSFGRAGDSAVSGTDYEPVPDLEIVIPAGQSFWAESICPRFIDDTLVEGDEKFSIVGRAGALNVDGTEVTIIDDETREPTSVTLSVDMDSVGEGAGATQVTVTATVDGDDRFLTDRTVMVSVGGDDDTATKGADYQAVADFPVTLAAGAASGSAAFTLTPIEDTDFEGNETIAVNGAASGFTVNSSASIEIADNDEPAMALTLSVDTDTDTDGMQSEIAESNGGTQVQVIARLTGSDRFQTDRTLMVRVGVADDSAVEGADYATIDDFPMTVEAGAASATGTFTLTPVDDTMAEAAETITVDGRLTGASVASTWITLADNDEAPNGIVLSASPASVREDARPTPITVTATVPGGTTHPVDTDVTIMVGSGTATSGADFSPVEDFTITIPGGESNASGHFALSPIDDDDSEGDETVAVTGAAGDIAVTATAVTIEDDEAPVRGIVLSASNVEVDEGGTASWTVRLSAAPDGPVAVTISGHEGTDLSLDTARLEFDETNWNSARTVTVTAGEDDDAADDTAILAHAASGGGYDSIAASLRIVTADNNTAAIVLEPDSLNLVEGRSRSYTVTLATEPSDDVGVAITGHAGTQLQLDRADLVFTPSDWNIPQSVTVTAEDDGVDGGARHVIIALTHTGSGGGYDGVAAELDIDALLDPITISITDAEGPEGSYLELLVTLSKPSPGDVEVDWGTHFEVAQAGRDFIPDGGRLRFAEGEREKVIRVWAEEDDLDDPNEIFTVELWNPSGAVLDDPVTDVPRSHYFDLTTETVVEIIQATGTIIGPAPDPLVLSIGASESFVDEGGTTNVRVTATVANELERPIRVPLVYADGTAEDGDYEAEPGLWIRTGETQGSAVITAFHDEDTDDETITVSIGELRPLEVVAGDDNSFELTILDDDGAGDPAGLTVSVEDATAEEGKENLRFLVRLSQPADSPITVRAETRDGTASADSDYLHGSGEVRFAPGERIQTFTVWVLDDAIDEGHETLTLQLSNPDPAEVTIARATATGTIKNSDPMPAAWLARFGRAVAEQALDGIATRMAADRTPGLRGSIAGQALDFSGGAAGGPDLSQSPGSLSGAGGAGPGSWGAGPGLLFGSGVEAQSRSMTMQEVLRGSSFSLTGEADGSGGTLSFWGGSPGSGGLVSGSRFAGNQRGDGTAVHLSGETGAALLGTDYARGRWLVGFALSQVRAEGGYASEGGSDCSGLPASVPASACAVAAQAGDGEVEASLTATIPYVALAVSDRLRLWGAAGQGAGDVTVKTGPGGSYRADTAWSMAAAGLRGDLLAPPAPGPGSGAGSGPGSGTGPALALTSDALWVRTSSEKTGDLAASESDVSRLRVGLEGSWGVALSGGGSVTPKLELGARHDGGDAETGFGVELGGGLAWRDPGLGLTLDLSGRTLVAHDDGGLEDRGVSARLSYDPEPSSGRGLSLSLGQDWGGRSAGGLDALFQPEPLEDRAGSGGGHEATSRWAMEAAWGLPALGGRFTGSPYMGLGLATGARDYSLGWRLAPEAATGLSFGLRATRRESDTASPEHVLGIEATTRW